MNPESRDSALAFYPSSRACARLPETVQSQSGHVCCGTSPWRSQQRPYTNRTRSARETRRGRASSTRPGPPRPRQHAGGDIAPQRDHELARHGDDPNAAAALPTPEVRPVPLREGALRLPPHPMPGQLNADRLEAGVPGATDALLVLGLAAVVGRGGKPRSPPIWRRFGTPATPTLRRPTPRRWSSPRPSTAPAGATHSSGPPPSPPPAAAPRARRSAPGVSASRAVRARQPCLHVGRQRRPRPIAHAWSTNCRAGAPAARQPQVASQPRI